MTRKVKAVKHKAPAKKKLVQAVQQTITPQPIGLPIITDAPTSLKLDIGCGPNKRPGYTGIDSRMFNGVDLLLDVRLGLPQLDSTVDEIFSSHFVEHLTGPERVGFFNEIYRVMKPGATAHVITPHWSHACAYGDPTHQWPPMSEWMVYYLNRQWRDMNAPHTGYTCDFAFQFAGSWDPWLEPKNIEFRGFAMNRYTNSWRDLHVTLTKLTQ